MRLSDLTIVTPYGTHESSCGYCKSSNGSHTYDLIDRGWRRSGTYLYKPNLRDSCCPQYTIRMEALKYRASKHQRNLVNRFNRFASEEGDETFEREIQAQLGNQGKTEGAKDAQPSTKETGVHVPDEANTDQNAPLSDADANAQAAAEAKRQKQKQKKVLKEMPKSHVDKIHLAEYSLHPDQTKWRHRFKVKLEPASFTPEKHAIYIKYQTIVHNDVPSHVTADSFKRFLVTSPLKATKPDTWTEQDPGYGSFHQCYYLDEKLIAVSVIDILPNCVSAVYFFYDPDYSALSLGKYSAQREIALVQELHQNPEYASLQYYYMGFYIFTCPKMSYKAQYEPSFLLDPETYTWVEFETCKRILGDKRYSSWIHPEEPNPLFEEHVQLIRDTKKTPKKSKRDDADDDEDEDDQWDSTDDDGEEDEDEDLDPDEFMDNAMEESEAEDDHGKKEGSHNHDSEGDENVSSPRKRAKQDGNHNKKKAGKEEEEEEKKQKREAAALHAKERERVYEEVKSQRPPGWLDPQKIGPDQMVDVLYLNNRNEISPIVLTSKYTKQKSFQDTIAEYYAAVGDEMAKRMIVYC
ncbi:Arginyl-tRNA--protein transferase 1 [Actinomortierella ambigua]|nr:Arginyl-tRNA--protein transferase 1 [Actinomortierella ambigua]